MREGRGDGGPDGRDESIADAFWSVARRMRHRSSESLAPWDISPSQHRALSVLRRGGPMRAGQLSALLRIAPRSATEVIDALEERTFVRRRPDPDDRRATQVELTDAGREVVEAIHRSHASETDAMFAQLTDTDRAQLARILRKLRDAPDR